VSFNRAEDPDEEAIVAEINVTPLTDIFLVLLIIFMVTSSALTQQGAQVNLPKASGGSAAPAGIVVTATADRRLSVNGRSTTIDELGAVLREAFDKVGERNVILQGDRSVVLEDAVRIMTVARGAGAEKLSIATEPEPRGETR